MSWNERPSGSQVIDMNSERKKLFQKGLKYHLPKEPLRSTLHVGNRRGLGPVVSHPSVLRLTYCSSWASPLNSWFIPPPDTLSHLTSCAGINSRCFPVHLSEVVHSLAVIIWNSLPRDLWMMGLLAGGYLSGLQWLTPDLHLY